MNWRSFEFVFIDVERSTFAREVVTSDLLNEIIAGHYRPLQAILRKFARGLDVFVEKKVHLPAKI